MSDQPLVKQLMPEAIGRFLPDVTKRVSRHPTIDTRRWGLRQTLIAAYSMKNLKDAPSELATGSPWVWRNVVSVRGSAPQTCHRRVSGRAF